MDDVKKETIENCCDKALVYSDSMLENQDSEFKITNYNYITEIIPKSEIICEDDFMKIDPNEKYDEPVCFIDSIVDNNEKFAIFSDNFEENDLIIDEISSEN
ncbi:hypothetical protein DMUE_4139 [Dictyocoela muelleri]|nr:hypothetical protein DMUE_4139 [Dictyocoela muelleri]